MPVLEQTTPVEISPGVIVQVPVQQQQEIPPPATAPPPEPEPWKPDFRPPESGGPSSRDPWEGMPPDYEGIATFVPTPENPTPPWEQPAGGGGGGGTTVTQPPPNIPKYGTTEYQERAYQVAEKQLKPYIKAGAIDVDAVVRSGKIEYLRGLGVEEAKIKELQAYAYAKGGKKAKEKAEEAILADYVELKDGEYVTKADWDRLDAKYQKIGKSKGFEAMQKAMQADYEAALAQAPGEPKTAAEAFKLLPKDAQEVYKESGAEDRFSILKAHGAVPANAEYVKADTKGNPMWKLGSGTTEAIVGSKNLPLLAAEIAVPGVYLSRHWKNLSTGEKAVTIVLDAMTLVPFAGAAARGAKGVTAIGRGARFAGAAKGIAAEAVAQVKAPVTMVLHPVSTVKGAAAAGRDTLENLVHLKKVPEAVITTTNSTVRIPVSTLGTEAKANAARNTLMKTLKETGGDVVIDFNGQKFTVTRSALMKEVGGGLAHATPMGEAFQEGLKVTAKPGMSAAEQGLFLSHEPLPRFATSSAFGKTGERPAVLIVSKNIARDAISTEKIYPSATGRVAELESKFPTGYQVPKPTQRLFTRIGPEKVRVDILLVDAKLSPAQIAKLKSLAVLEDFKAPFRPAMLIEGKGRMPASQTARVRAGLSDDEVRELARALRRSGNAEAAANLLRVNRAAMAARRVPAGRVARTPAAEVRFTRPGQRRVERLAIIADGTPRMRVRRDVARTTRGKDIEIRRTEPQERRRDIAEGREPPTIRVYSRKEILRPEGERGRVPRPGMPRLDIPRPERGRVEDRFERRRMDTGREERRIEGEERKGRIKLPGGGKEKPWSREDVSGAVAWKQGAFIWAVRAPYSRNEDWKAFTPDNLPEGLKIGTQRTAFETIQLYQGKRAPGHIFRDLGIVDVHIRRPSREPGRRGAISFTPDRSHSRAALSRDIYAHGGTLSHRAKGKRLSRRGLLRR